MPEHQARRFFLQVEQILLLADAAVVAHFGFFNALDVGVELLLVGPCGAVDALQLLVLGIAAPVRAGNAGELERLEEARVRHVRAAAHVHVFKVVVHAHRGDVRRHVFNQAQLVVLAAGLEDFDHFRAWRHLLDDVVVLRNQFAHALFDGGHVIRRERALGVDVVIKTLGDHRADDHLHIRVQLLDRVADQMRAGVTDDFHALLVLGGDDAQAGVVADNVAGVHQHAIRRTGDGRFSKAGTDGLGHVHDADRVFELTDAAVGESDVDHGFTWVMARHSAGCEARGVAACLGGVGSNKKAPAKAPATGPWRDMESGAGSAHVAHSAGVWRGPPVCWKTGCDVKPNPGVLPRRPTNGADPWPVRPRMTDTKNPACKPGFRNHSHPEWWAVQGSNL